MYSGHSPLVKVFDAVSGDFLRYQDAQGNDLLFEPTLYGLDILNPFLAVIEAPTKPAYNIHGSLSLELINN